MSERENKRRESVEFADLAATDAYLDRLAQGDASAVKGSEVAGDELTALLLDLHAEVNQEMPPAPIGLAGSVDKFAHSAGSAAVPSAGRWSRSPQRPWLYGLIGAAAATVLLAGAGAVMMPLIRSHQEATVVELASTLEKIESSASKGDEDTMQALIQQAQNLLSQLRDNQRIGGRGQERSGETEVRYLPGSDARSTETVRVTGPRETVTETQPALEPEPRPSEAPRPAAPVTVVERVTERATETVTEQTVVTETVEVTKALAAIPAIPTTHQIPLGVEPFDSEFGNLNTDPPKG